VIARRRPRFPAHIRKVNACFGQSTVQFEPSNFKMSSHHDKPSWGLVLGFVIALYLLRDVIFESTWRIEFWALRGKQSQRLDIADLSENLCLRSPGSNDFTNVHNFSILFFLHISAWKFAINSDDLEISCYQVTHRFITLFRKSRQLEVSWTSWNKIRWTVANHPRQRIICYV